MKMAIKWDEKDVIEAFEKAMSPQPQGNEALQKLMESAKKKRIPRS